MQCNNKFGMKDLFMNKELEDVFPQFTKNDELKNVYSFAWVEKKVADYIKSVFNGQIVGEDVIIYGKHKQKFREINGLKTLIEEMFNNISAITKNIRKNTKLITPFQSIEQLKQIKDPNKKVMAMQIIFDNLNYNPDFKSERRFSSEYMQNDYYKRQSLWLKSVGYESLRRNV